MSTQAMHQQTGLNGGVLHLDSVKPYCSRGTVKRLKFTCVPHVPYNNTDLIPSDFLFPKVEKVWKCQHFSADAEVEVAVLKWSKSIYELYEWNENVKLERTVKKLAFGEICSC